MTPQVSMPQLLRISVNLLESCRYPKWKKMSLGLTHVQIQAEGFEWIALKAPWTVPGIREGVRKFQGRHSQDRGHLEARGLGQRPRLPKSKGRTDPRHSSSYFSVRHSQNHAVYIGM